ncbi:unnamed protein product [Medioppia subpectinata]|uniref:Serine protease n=1 Tax=Medioppia subpectinata TaxID=1979941 RepID=A0A7R9KZI7_9ACAR|nr:unnamed protein product [Medioppia subpectinata]CAG2112565.1 unnamed protein product [Medioppia subpectinata]
MKKPLNKWRDNGLGDLAFGPNISFHKSGVTSLSANPNDFSALYVYLFSENSFISFKTPISSMVSNKYYGIGNELRTPELWDTSGSDEDPSGRIPNGHHVLANVCTKPKLLESYVIRFGTLGVNDRDIQPRTAIHDTRIRYAIVYSEASNVALIVHLEAFGEPQTPVSNHVTIGQYITAAAETHTRTPPPSKLTIWSLTRCVISVHMSDGKDLTIDEIYRKYINYFVKIMHVTSKYPNGKYMVSWGSGVCLGGTGYIVTNCHVVGEAGHWFVNRFKVDNNGDVCGLGVKDPITGAQVMYCSPQLDIAVIHSKCTVTADTEVQDVGFSISDGQHVVSIGNPTLPFCLSDGVVSCTGREGRTLCVDNYEYHMVYTDPTGLHITHTCSTYNGFSGGPLINMSGQLVGIHYGSIGRGTFREAFSINTASVWGVLNDMKLFSEKRHTYSAEKSLGLALRPMTRELWATLFGADTECTINEGLLVLRKLTTNSVSIPTDIRTGDTIVRVNDNPINSVKELRDYCNNCNPNEVLDISYRKHWNKQIVANVQQIRLKFFIRSALMSQNKELTFDDIYEKYVNYFVKIHNTTGKRPNGQFAWGWGSGVCLGGSGYILTNCHVVGDWGLWFTERFQVDNEGDVRGLGINDGITYSRVMYCSPRLDIAIVYSKCTEADDIGLQELGFSTHVGQHVVSIGNPMLEFCLIDGVVNCVGREGRTLCVDTHEYFMVFTDPTGLHLNHSCPIVQGFSGGPVLNMSGQLVGINYGSIGHGTFRDTFGINTADITG